MMPQALIAHIRRFVPVDETAAAQLSAAVRHISLRKKELLLSEGQVCRRHFFVVKGCLRLFFVDEKGTEQTTHFAIEDWWMSEYGSLERGTPSVFCIQAVEATEVLSLDAQAQEALLEKVPAFSLYYAKMLHRAYGASQLRVRLMKEQSREALYRHFSAAFPEFVQRIPQYMLASYLGFTPEYLSEIRKRLTR